MSIGGIGGLERYPTEVNWALVVAIPELEESAAASPTLRGGSPHLRSAKYFCKTEFFLQTPDAHVRVSASARVFNFRCSEFPCSTPPVQPRHEDLQSSRSLRLPGRGNANQICIRDRFRRPSHWNPCAAYAKWAPETQGSPTRPKPKLKSAQPGERDRQAHPIRAAHGRTPCVQISRISISSHRLPLWSKAPCGRDK